MFTEKDLVFSVPKGDKQAYLKAVQGTEKIFLDILRNVSDPVTAAYKTYTKLIKENASMLEIEGMAQLIKKMDAIPEAEQKEFILKESLYYDGQLVSIGTLFLGDEICNTKDMIRCNGAEQISIKDTVRGREMQFVAATIDGKQLLVSNRVILNNVSWSSLNEQRLITGKPLNIDGKNFILRVLTGGDGNNGPSEWNQALELTKTSRNLDNSKNTACWCQEELTDNFCRARGMVLGSYYSMNKNCANQYTGWRPVLELI